MAEDRMRIGVVIARKILKSPWADEAWMPHAVLPAAPDLEEGARLDVIESGEIFYAGSAEIELHSGQTAHYRDNLGSGSPSVWIALKPGEGARRGCSATVDPYEGESMAEGVGEIVEAVPMPALIQDFVRLFVQEHHVERPFIKRQRDRIGNRESGGPPKPGR
ncbi:MAG: DUF3305 domain-containing protein [Beijerinckiaceae bacterium]|nr:DUF3305 domain-containing protein [Beijerinckiaceae bacterium]MDO9443171.1 DUF3305 domain-containing protein [Beijerinckiaceae bacterium]